MVKSFKTLRNMGTTYFLWHDAIMAQNASHIASTYLNMLATSDPCIETFIFWTDNLSTQNQNWTLFWRLQRL